MQIKTTITLTLRGVDKTKKPTTIELTEAEARELWTQLSKLFAADAPGYKHIPSWQPPMWVAPNTGPF